MIVATADDKLPTSGIMATERAEHMQQIYDVGIVGGGAGGLQGETVRG